MECLKNKIELVAWLRAAMLEETTGKGKLEVARAIVTARADLAACSATRAPQAPVGTLGTTRLHHMRARGVR